MNEKNFLERIIDGCRKNLATPPTKDFEYISSAFGASTTNYLIHKIEKDRRKLGFIYTKKSKNNY